MQTNIKFVKLWSGWLRLAHWVIATTIIFQIVSAWAQNYTLADQAFWHDWHLMAGQILIIAVLLRIILLIRPGTSHWRSFIPTSADYSAMTEMIRFYLSFARAPLPNWYAHNPLWKLIYALFYLFLVICLMSGIFHDSPFTVAGLRIDSIHATTATVITVFTTLHILAVFLHDLKGKGALISGMISGSRYFHVEPVSPEQFTNDKPGESIISFDKIGKTAVDNKGNNSDLPKE